jgi:hypothetical protein
MTLTRFDINGKCLDVEEMFNSPARATAVMLIALRHHFDERFGDLRCPVHDRPPTIRFYGPSAVQMDREVQGCCDELVEMARRSM